MKIDIGTIVRLKSAEQKFVVAAIDGDMITATTFANGMQAWATGPVEIFEVVLELRSHKIVKEETFHLTGDRNLLRGKDGLIKTVASETVIKPSLHRPGRLLRELREEGRIDLGAFGQITKSASADMWFRKGERFKGNAKDLVAVDSVAFHAFLEGK